MENETQSFLLPIQRQNTYRWEAKLRLVLGELDSSFISKEATENIPHLLLNNTRGSIEQFGKQGFIYSMASHP